MSFDQTREIIIQTAQRLFARFGFQKTSMDEIARKARKAKASLYYHFKSKEDLFREVVQKEISEIQLFLKEIVQEPLPADQKLKKYLIKRFEMIMQAINYLESLRSDFLEHLEFIEDVRKEFVSWEKDQVVTILEEGIRENLFNESVKNEKVFQAILRFIRGLEFAMISIMKEKSVFFDFSIEIEILLQGLKHYKKE
jgi:AcrR family transcriptional regulator